MGILVFRPVLLSLMAVSLLATPASAIEFATEGKELALPPIPETPPVPPMSSDCADLTLVDTYARDPRIDVYIAKAEAFPDPPEDPSLSDLAAYLDEAKEKAWQALFTDPELSPSERPDVQVEIVFPNDEESPTAYRFTLLVRFASCLPA